MRLLPMVSLLLVLPLVPVAQATRACSDGIDNDGDGATDYPTDTGCTNDVDNNEAPYQARRFYFHAQCLNGIYVQCTSDQPATTAPPTDPVGRVHPMKPPQHDGLSWVTPRPPAVQYITLSGESVTVRVWADALRGTDGDFVNARVALYQRLWGNPGGTLVASAPLAYQPGTGIHTSVGVENGQFVATFRDVSVTSATLVAQIRMASVDLGQFDVRFDGTASPSCLGINTSTC